MRAFKMHEDERGAVAIIVALLLVVLFMAAAFSIDIGTQVSRRQIVRNATDSAGLAGASYLPGDPTSAKNAAISYAIANDSVLTAATVDVTFRCLIGDRNGDGLPDLADVPGACTPGSANLGTFVCDNGLCTAMCNPATGGVCNTIVVGASEAIAFKFAPVGGVSATSSTGKVLSAACIGYCGATPKSPLDIGLIIDRTSSMSATDLANAKQAALTMLGYLDPAYDSLALGVIYKSKTASQCSGSGYGLSINDNEFQNGAGTFVAYPYPAGPLSTNYLQSNGSINSSSLLVKTINCLVTSSFSFLQTDLGNPVAAMTSMLHSKGRAGVPKVIVLETDGEANLPYGQNPCSYAVDQAALAKAAGDELFTIGFGIAGKTCSSDTSGTYKNATVTKVLANMATTSTDGGCVAAENSDGDHFFCEPKSGDLSTVFAKVASAILSAPHLVRLPF